MPTTRYSRSTPEARTLTQALRCPVDSPWHRLALRVIRRALCAPTKRAAAEKLGMHETVLSALLKRHPELKSSGLTVVRSGRILTS